MSSLWGELGRMSSTSPFHGRGKKRDVALTEILFVSSAFHFTFLQAILCLVMRDLL